MNLWAHITTPDSVAFVAVYALGILTGAALSWIAGRAWQNRHR